MRMSFQFLLTVLCTLIVSQTLLGERHLNTSHIGVRQQVDSILHNLKLNLASTAQDEERWMLLYKSQKQILQLRQESPIQFLSDEKYLNTIMIGLNVMPMTENLNLQNCDANRATLMGKFVSTAEAKPVFRVLEILEKLCRF